MMLTIRVDGYEIDLSPLKDVLASTKVDANALDQLALETADPLTRQSASSSKIWSDLSFRTKTAQRLAVSVPNKLAIDDLPKLPDQLALLLRSELMMAMNQYSLETEQKDEAEQLLQDILRPIVYHLIERHYAGKPNAEPAAIVSMVISQTIATNWQSVMSGKWEIYPLDSMIGPIGYEFRTADEVMYSDRPLSGKGEFFFFLATALVEQMCSIRLE